MKKALLIALVLGSVSTATAQTSNIASSRANECKLKLAQAPAIRGIHLGMTASQVLSIFPGAEKSETIQEGLSRPRFGFIDADVVPSYYGCKPAVGGKALFCDGFEVSVQMRTENSGNMIKVRNL
ncbi:MAG: hypothetical protein WAV47_00475 [Blastocatellia bacterium]